MRGRHNPTDTSGAIALRSAGSAQRTVVGARSVSDVARREKKAPGTGNKLGTPVLRGTQDKIVRCFAIFFSHQLIIRKSMPDKVTSTNKKMSTEYQQTTDDLVVCSSLVRGAFQTKNNPKALPPSSLGFPVLPYDSYAIA